jgi:hypothetical protein
MMALSDEDRQQLGDILKPLSDATESQARTLKGQAETLSKFGERMATVESDVGHIKESVEAQRKHCRDVTTDFAKQLREDHGNVAEAQTCAKAAKNSAKEAKEDLARLRGWLWGITGGLILALLKMLYDQLLKKGGP